MRTLAPLALLSLVIVAAPAAAATGTTQVVQQRLGDGRILLTDQPVRGATIERSWQLPVEDPAVARQRAAEASAEVERVTERVQRMIEQDRRADAERERTRLAALAMAQQQQRDDEPVYYGGVVPYGYGTGLGAGLGHGHARVGHHGKFVRTDRWGSTEKFGTVGKFAPGNGPQPMAPHGGRAFDGR